MSTQQQTDNKVHFQSDEERDLAVLRVSAINGISVLNTEQRHDRTLAALHTAYVDDIPESEYPAIYASIGNKLSAQLDLISQELKEQTLDLANAKKNPSIDTTLYERILRQTANDTQRLISFSELADKQVLSQVEIVTEKQTPKPMPSMTM